jgi:hypothetical protein
MAERTTMQGEFSEQELLAQNVKNAIQARKVMSDLDKIQTPLECTIYMAGNKSTYRNDAYRKWLSKMDTDTKKELDKFIKENKEKELS